MSATTSKYEAADAKIQNIYRAVSNPENLRVRFRTIDSEYDFVIYYESVKFDHTPEFLIRDYDFIVHPDSYDSDTVTVYNLY